MGNCVISKFNGSLEDDNLCKIGEFAVPVSLVSSSTIILKSSAYPYKVSIVGDGKMALTQEGLVSDPLTQYTVTSSSAMTLYLSAGNYLLKIENKYSLHTFNVYFQTTGEDIKYLHGINTLVLRQYNGKLSDVVFDKANLQNLSVINSEHAIGDIAVLADLDLSSLYISDSPNICGDISSLGSLIHLSQCSILNSGVTGSIEGFVEGQVDNGRTTADFYFSGGLQRLTFGGVDYHLVSSGNIGWESRTKMYWYNTNKVWCKGYTQSEAGTKWPNKTIVRVDA